MKTMTRYRVSRGSGWGFGNKMRGLPYVTANAHPPTEEAFAAMVGRLYAAGLAVEEPFTKFTWKLSPVAAYACLYAEADDGDCIRNGPMHKERRRRIASQMTRALEQWKLTNPDG